jgi:beta-lactamase class A
MGSSRLRLRFIRFRRLVGYGVFFFAIIGTASHVASAQEGHALDNQLEAIAQAHHGHVAVYAQNLKTGQTASLDADEPVQTASVIKLGILLDAAEQVRSGTAKLDEKLVLTKENQVPGSGVLAQLDTPLALTLRDALTLMVIVSDNTATNMAIDRLGLAHVDATLRAAGLKETWLYKKVYKPAEGTMPADQPKFGLGKTTAREMALVMGRLAECRLDLRGGPPQPADGPICGAMLLMLRAQQDRDSLPRYIESLDTSEHGSAIGDKIGALDRVRNDVALISTKSGPVVISAFTWDNADQRWTGDNEAEQTLGKIGKAVVDRWSPEGLDATSFNWENPLANAVSASKP